MLDSDYEVIKADVDLFSLPTVTLETPGHEVVLDIQTRDVQNTKGEFWTDSNGMQMQKRVLNHRDYFDMVAYNGGPGANNITSNFFPVTTAISLTNDDGTK